MQHSMTQDTSCLLPPHQVSSDQIPAVSHYHPETLTEGNRFMTKMIEHASSQGYPTGGSHVEITLPKGLQNFPAAKFFIQTNHFY